MPKICPGYKTGFAAPTRNKNYLYPTIWDGCRGAWAACLGETGGEVKDQSGFSNHSTLVNMLNNANSPWVTSGGKTALEFDGLNDHITTNFVPFDPNNDFSLSCWFLKSGATASRGFLGANSNVDNNPRCNLGFQNLADLITFTITGGFTLNSVRALNDGLWHSATITRSGTLFSLYVDGTLDAQATNTPTVGSYNTFTIGGWRRTTTSFFMLGCLDDLFVHNRAITPNEHKILAMRRGIAYERREPSYFAHLVALINRRLSSRNLCFPG